LSDSQIEISFTAEIGLRVYLHAELIQDGTVIASGDSAAVTVKSETEISLVLSETSAASTVYVSGTGSVLAAGSDDSGTGTLAKPYASLSRALSSYNSDATSGSPYTIVIDGTVTLSEVLSETLSQNMYVTFMPLASGTAGAVIAVAGGYGLNFVSDDTETSTSYTAEITFDGISFTGYTGGALEASGSKMTMTVRNCTFTPSPSATAADTCSIKPLVHKFILGGTNTFNGSPVELAGLTNCSTSDDSGNSFITLGVDISASAGSIPVYVSGVSGSNTQKIVVKADGTALTSTELACFTVTPSADYYLSLSSDSLYAYLVGTSTATVTLDTPLSTVYAVPYLTSFSAASVAGYISADALSLSAGDTVYAAAVQLSDSVYSLLSASSCSMILYDTSGTSLSDAYSALAMDSGTNSITLPAWMPAGTYCLSVAVEYNNFWYTKTYTLTVE
jgi:hypothetical protein